MSNFIARIIGAARLDTRIYEEVEADKEAMKQAMGIVVLSSVAAGLGTGTIGGARGVIGGIMGALLGWFIWAYLTYLIGTKILPRPQTKADYGEVLRTIGFASSPGLIRIFGLVPGLTKVSFLIASIWMLAAMVIAVRQALDYNSSLRAVGVCLIGWIIQCLILVVLFGLLGR